MAESGGDTEMLDAPTKAMRKLEVGETFGIAHDELVMCSIDFGSTFSSIYYDIARRCTPLSEVDTARNRVTDINQSHRIASEAAFWMKTIGTKTFCDLVLGARAQQDPASTGYKLVAKFDKLKMSVVSEGAEVGQQDLKILRMTREVRMEHERLISEVLKVLDRIPGGKYRIFDPLTSQFREEKLVSIDCVTGEFIRFLWDSAKADFARKHGLRVEDVVKIFAEKAQVVISIPTISAWEVTTTDNLRAVMHIARLPPHICIWSEGQASALYNLYQVAKTSGRSIAEVVVEEETKVVCDIGGLTADCSCLVIHDANEEGSSIRLGEPIPGIGSLSGSSLLNQSFLKELLLMFPQGFSTLLPGFQGTEQDVLAAFDRGFEEGKRGYTGMESEFIVRPRFLTNQQMTPVRTADFVVKPECREEMIFEQNVMRRIATPWVSDVKDTSQSFFDQVIQKTGTQPSEVDLTGCGSLPPFVLDYLKAAFEARYAGSVTVKVVEPRFESSVAQGAFLRLTMMDVKDFQQARSSFGIRGREDLVPKNANLNGTITYVHKDHLTLENPIFPLEHHLAIHADFEFGPYMDPIALLKLDIPSLQARGFQLQYRKEFEGDSGKYNDAKHLRLEYELTLVLGQLVPEVKMTIPYGGSFDGPRRAFGNDMTFSVPVKCMYKHFVFHSFEIEMATIPLPDEATNEETMEEEPDVEFQTSEDQSSADQPPPPPTYMPTGYNHWWEDLPGFMLNDEDSGDMSNDKDSMDMS